MEASQRVVTKDPPRNGRAAGLRLSRTHLYTTYSVAAGVWLTGAAWLIYHYFMQTEGPFGFQKHPLETFSLKLHGGFSFAALWLLGSLWWVHVLRGWTSRWRRWSGGWLTAAFVILVITGWGLYYFVERQWREWTSLAHWIIGLAAAVLFLAHWLSRSAPRRVE